MFGYLPPANRRRSPRSRLTAASTLVAVCVVGVWLTTQHRGGHRTTAHPARLVSRATTDPDHATGLLATTLVARYLKGREGDITAAVLNLRTGQLSQWHPEMAEDTASIVKVDILATLLHRLQETGASLTPAQRWLAETMIEDSSDASATTLWDEVGRAAGVAEFDALLGLDQTRAGTDGYWGLTTTTAVDQVHLLRALVVPNAILTTASRHYELSLMENVEPEEDWGVSSGPGRGVTVALKNGWLPQSGDADWQVNSVGWVDGDGRDYLVAVLTAGSNTEQYGIDTIQGLSSLIWKQLRS